jgi:hypothetical protein
MPPEELEKMHHIEKHIRKNKMKVRVGISAACWMDAQHLLAAAKCSNVCVARLH